MRLYDKLIKYSGEDILPMHMPGHKRNRGFRMENPYSFDITEIRGMDDLFKPQGIIKDLMDDCADYYGTKKTYLLVNGSTSGNLSSIAATCDYGAHILTDDTCHRSVDHAVELLGLRRHLLKRNSYDDEKNVQMPGQVNPNEVERLLKELSDKNEKPSAVFITSPTYEGVVSDIRGIADIVHAYDIPLIVDEAHGAHLTLAQKTCAEKMSKTSEKCKLDWPEPATKQGADLVIESLHKTLPSLTQTALLHRCSDRVSDEKLAHCHDIFTTSSPSYVLMSSIDICMEWQKTKGISTFDAYDCKLAEIYAECDLVGTKDRDPSKIVLEAGKYGDLGDEIAGKLREKGCEPELVKDDYVVLMTSPADGEENLMRLKNILKGMEK
ncbi:MAG: aminotransferase class I/II-fold pyridoxal phosphate-dependent enzyme [Eubacterium sp.]|nr:aminotransferase class I/II-fold pyridoxal phosphate-dependent enzyme [Eubacterium sp.]